MTGHNLKVFLSLFLVIIVDTMGLGLVFPVLSPLVLEKTSILVDPSTSLSIREMLYAAVIGIFSLSLLIGAPLIGDLSDSIGRKKALLICVSGTAISFLLCGIGILQGSLILLLMGRAINGFTAGSNSIAQAAIADMSSKENKTKNLGLITLANCIGFVLGPVFGGYFAEHPVFPSAGFSMPFFIAGFLAFTNIIFLLFFVNDSKAQVRRKLHFQLSMGIRIFIDALRLKSMRRVSLVFLFLQLSWSIYFQFISIVLINSYGYGATKIGIFMTYIGLLFSFCLAFLVRILLRLTTIENIIRLSFVIVSISLVICPLIHSEINQWLIAIPITLSIGLLYTGGLSLFSNAVDKTQQGWVMGVSAAVAAVAWTLGAIFAGILGKWGVEWPFLIAAVTSFLGFILSIKIREHKTS